MNIDVLKGELLVGHPDTGPYDADDALAADQLNVVNRKTNKTTMEASEVMQAIDAAELNVLAADKQRQVWDVLHLGTVNPFGTEATILTTVFGAGSETITALAALRKYDVSRAVELGLGVIRAGNVQEARL